MLIKKYFFLFLFFVASIAFGYASIYNKLQIVYITKFFLVPSIAIHYILNTKKFNVFYITALVFALIGDLLFSETSDFLIIMGMGSFIIFNLLIIVVVFETFGLVDSKKITSIAKYAILIFGVFIFFLFRNIGGQLIILSMYFAVLAVLFSFCLYYYLKYKTIVSLYFFMGVVVFFFANISKGLIQYEAAKGILIIVNIVCYALSHYLYCTAILLKENNSKIS